ncbi:MAG: hypothetical protein KJ587_05640 [Alphaproteobacteria bacterium]|nr:hypothetical protein [Alphaproteobacteria bacterium]
MTALAWQTIEPIPAQRMNEARRQAHNALHWLARIANSYLGDEEGNAQLQLIWNDEANSIRTKEFGPGLSVEARLGVLELQFCEDGKPATHTLSFEEHTPAHVEAWVLVELLHRDVDRDKFSKDLPYTPKDLMLGDSEEHEAEAYAAELKALQGWLRNAAAVLTAVRHDLSRDADADYSKLPVACCPQTFQLNLELPLPAGSGAGALRAGLSAGDALRPEPFFFVATDEQALAGNFDAASILSVQRIAADKLAADDVIQFLRDQVAAHRKRLAS